MNHRHLAFAILVLLVGATTAGAEQKCKPVVGHFEAVALPPEQCPGPFCTVGRVWGGLQGTYRFVMNTIVPNGEPDVPTIFFFTGRSDITLKTGDHLLGVDTGVIDVSPVGGFASLITFTGGTGSTTGATGQIRLRGELADGTTSGDYIGTLCTPE